MAGEEITSESIKNMITPNIPSIQLTPELVNQVLIGLMVASLLFYVFKMNRNRIIVEINEKVHGGVVPKAGRYRLSFDRKKKMYDLLPMFGGEILPAYPSNCFQKVRGMPLIGALRQLTLFKINKYSYAVILPTTENDNSCSCMEVDTKSWIYKEITRSFEKALFRKNFIYFLSTLAPLVVIAGGFILIGVGLYSQMTLFKYFASRIQETIDMICKVKGVI